MSRSAKLLALGCVLVLGLAIALWKLMDTAPATASAKTPVVDKDEPRASEPETKAAPAADKVEAPAGTTVAARPSITEYKPLGANEPVIPRDENGKLLVAIDKVQLAEANVATDDKIRECIKLGPSRVNGTAMLTFVIAKSKDKSGKETLVAEDSGYDEDGTSITDQKLLECMHKTASQMNFPPPPKSNAVAVYGKRKVVIEDGILRINTIAEFGRIR